MAASPSRNAPQVSQNSKTRPGRGTNVPTVSRTPLIRAPQSVASDIPRGKAPPGAFPSQSRDSRRQSRPSRFVDRRNGDQSVHDNYDRDRGLVHIGVNRDRAYQQRSGLYDYAHSSLRHRHYRPYGDGHYYRNYRPIYYPGCNSYYPYWGYSYASAYLSTPYVVQVYNDPPAYGSSTYMQEPPPAAVVQEPPPAASSRFDLVGPSRDLDVESLAFGLDQDLDQAVV